MDTQSLIPEDVERFLYELGTQKTVNPVLYHQYIRTVATLLYDKYVILPNPSICVYPERHASGSTTKT